MTEVEPSPFWSATEHELLADLRSSTEGLSQEKAEKRRLDDGGLALGKRPRSSLDILWSQFNNPIIWLLLVSALVSYYLDDAVNAMIISVIIALSGLMSFWQERSAADGWQWLSRSDGRLSWDAFRTDCPNRLQQRISNAV